MKEFMEAILVVGPQHIELLPKAIGGQICRERLWNTSESVINANGLRRAYTNQGEFLIRYLAHGHLLNVAWTLWDHSPKQWEIRNISWSAQIILLSGLKWNL